MGIDLTTFDLEKHGHWKLLYYEKHFNEVRMFLVGYYITPAMFLEGLGERLSLKEGDSWCINWEHVRNSDRIFNYVGKALRLFRRYSSLQDYLNFLRKDHDNLHEGIQLIAKKNVELITK